MDAAEERRRDFWWLQQDFINDYGDVFGLSRGFLSNLDRWNHVFGAKPGNYDINNLRSSARITLEQAYEHDDYHELKIAQPAPRRDPNWEFEHSSWGGDTMAFKLREITAKVSRIYNIDEKNESRLLDVYRSAGATTSEQIIAMAESIGKQALLETRAALMSEGPLAKDMHDELDVIMDEAERGADGWKRMLQDLLLRAADAHEAGRADGENADYRLNLPFGSYNSYNFDDNGRFNKLDVVPPVEATVHLRAEAHLQLAMIIDPSAQKPSSQPYTPLRSSDNAWASEWSPETIARFQRKILNAVGQIAELSIVGGTKSESKRPRLNEALSSTVALTFVKPLPVGKNTAAAVRKLTAKYDKVILMVLPGKLPYNRIVGMLRASLSDVANKLETYQHSDDAPALGGIFAKLVGGRSPSMKDGGAVDIIVDPRDAGRLSAEMNAGDAPVDTSLVRVIPTQSAKDSDTLIDRALRMNDVNSLKRLLDPTVFSDPSRIEVFRQTTNESKYKSFVNDDSNFDGVPNWAYAEKLYPESSVAWDRDNGGDEIVWMGDRVIGATDAGLRVEEPDGSRWRFNGHGWQRAIKRSELFTQSAYGVWKDDVELLRVKDFSEALKMFGRNIEDLGFAGLRHELQGAMFFIAPNDKRGSSSQELYTILADGRRFVWSARDQEWFDDGPLGPRDYGRTDESVGAIMAPVSFGPNTGLRGSNSSSWSSGAMALTKPAKHVPDNEEEDRRSPAEFRGPRVGEDRLSKRGHKAVARGRADTRRAPATRKRV